MLHSREELNANHERFLTRVLETESVWAVALDSGFATAEAAESDGAVLLFWSDAAYARRAIQQTLDDGEPRELTLFDFLYRWLPGMSGDEVLAGVNWTGDLAGIEADPLAIQDELHARMPDDLKQRIREEFERQLADQQREDH